MVKRLAVHSNSWMSFRPGQSEAVPPGMARNPVAIALRNRPSVVTGEELRGRDGTPIRLRTRSQIPLACQSPQAARS